MKFLVIHGPNLNLLGRREPDIYGNITLEELNKRIFDYAKEKVLILKMFKPIKRVP